MKYIFLISLLFTIKSLCSQNIVGEYMDIDSSGSIELREDGSFFYGDLPFFNCHLGAYYYVGNYRIENNVVKLTTLPEEAYRFELKPFQQNDVSKLVIKLGSNLISAFKNVAISVNQEDMIYFKPDTNGIIEIVWDKAKWKFKRDDNFISIRLKTQSCYADFDCSFGNNNGFIINFKPNEQISNLYFTANIFEFKKDNKSFKLIRTTVKHPVIQELILAK
jgi:hypothetical protein